jgi:hypothetical protein
MVTKSNKIPLGNQPCLIAWEDFIISLIKHSIINAINQAKILLEI